MNLRSNGENLTKEPDFNITEEEEEEEKEKEQYDEEEYDKDFRTQLSSTIDREKRCKYSVILKTTIAISVYLALLSCNISIFKSLSLTMVICLILFQNEIVESMVTLF